MTSDERVDAQLREIAQAGTAGPSVADDVMRQIDQEPYVSAAPMRRWKRIVNTRHLKWMIPTAAAAAILLVVGLWPNHPGTPQGNGIVWAEVVRQFEQATTAYVESRQFEDGRLTAVLRCYLQAPDRLRVDIFEADGRTPKGTNHIEIGDQIIEVHPESRLCKTRDKRPGTGPNRVAVFLQLFGMRFGNAKAIEVDGEQIRFEPRGQREYEGTEYLRYAVLVDAAPPSSHAVELWLDPKAYEVRAFYESVARPGDPKHETISMVTLDRDFEDDVFGMADGCVCAEDGIWPRLSPDLLEIADSYYVARDRINHYRSIITSGKRNWPLSREVRNGDRWRLDWLDGPAMWGQNRDKYNFTGPDQPFEEVWGQINNPDGFLEAVFMPYQGGFAHVGYNYVGPNSERSKWVCGRGDIVWRGYDMHLANLGWPIWVDDELLAPHGWTLSEPPLTYKLLPGDPSRPNLVRVRAVRDTDRRCWYEYTIDPKRDYLCVRLEEQDSVRFGDAPEVVRRVKIREIVEFAQTPEGRWYPKTVTFREGRIVDGKVEVNAHQSNPLVRVMLDTTGEIDERFLEFPPSAPPLDSDPPAMSQWRVSDQRLKPPSMRTENM